MAEDSEITHKEADWNCLKADLDIILHGGYLQQNSCEEDMSITDHAIYKAILLYEGE